MSKFRITKFDVTNSMDSTPIISMDVACVGGITYTEVDNLRRIIEGDGKINYFSDWARKVLSTNDRFEIKKVIFNSPATIVYWTDGTKTVVKCQDGDKFIPETGLAMCFMKKALGNKSNFNNTFKKWIKNKTVGDIFDELPQKEQKRINNYILTGVKENVGSSEPVSNGKKKYAKTYSHLNSEAIYRILRENKSTVAELAKCVGVERSTVYYWLRGGGIKKRNISKLIKVLHVPEEVIIKEE